MVGEGLCLDVMLPPIAKCVKVCTFCVHLVSLLKYSFGLDFGHSNEVLSVLC